MMNMLAKTCENIIETARPRLRRVRVLNEIRNNVLLPAIFVSKLTPRLKRLIELH